jgi:hypothetical protein
MEINAFATSPDDFAHCERLDQGAAPQLVSNNFSSRHDICYYVSIPF